MLLRPLDADAASNRAVDTVKTRTKDGRLECRPLSVEDVNDLLEDWNKGEQAAVREKAGAGRAALWRLPDFRVDAGAGRPAPGDRRPAQRLCRCARDVKTPAVLLLRDTATVRLAVELLLAPVSGGPKCRRGVQ